MIDILEAWKSQFRTSFKQEDKNVFRALLKSSICRNEDMWSVFFKERRKSMLI